MNEANWKIVLLIQLGFREFIDFGRVFPSACRARITLGAFDQGYIQAFAENLHTYFTETFPRTLF